MLEYLKKRVARELVHLGVANGTNGRVPLRHRRNEAALTENVPSLLLAHEKASNVYADNSGKNEVHFLATLPLPYNRLTGNARAAFQSFQEREDKRWC